MRLFELEKIFQNEKIISDVEFDLLAPLVENHEGKKVLSFINNTKFLDNLYKNKNIAAVICTYDIYEEVKNKNYGIIISTNPKTTFFNIQNYLVKETDFYREEKETTIDKNVFIHPTAVISDKDVTIEKGVKILANSVIERGVTVKEGCYIGPNCILGGESFSYDGFNKIYAGGGVILEKNVELLGNISVEKGIYRDTIVGKNTKVSYGAVIEHDCEIGGNTLICANVTVTGRVKIGEGAYLGPGAIIRNGIEIKNNGRANMGAVVTKNIEESQSVSGNFAINHGEFIKKMKINDRIDE